MLVFVAGSLVPSQVGRKLMNRPPVSVLGGTAGAVGFQAAAAYVDRVVMARAAAAASGCAATVGLSGRQSDIPVETSGVPGSRVVQPTAVEMTSTSRPARRILARIMESRLGSSCVPERDGGRGVLRDHLEAFADLAADVRGNLLHVVASV